MGVRAGYPLIVALCRTEVLSPVRGLPAVAYTRRKTFRRHCSELPLLSLTPSPANGSVFLDKMAYLLLSTNGVAPNGAQWNFPIVHIQTVSHLTALCGIFFINLKGLPPRGSSKSKI